VIALAGPNTYTLALQRRFRCSPTVNVKRLKPYHARTDKPGPPGPVVDPGQAGEYVVEQLLNRKILRGRTYYLVRWQPEGHDSADDSWEPVEHLAHCPERVAEYEAAAPPSRRPKARRAAAAKSPWGGPPPAPAEATTPVAPAGWAVGPAGAPALGASVLYWWPAYGRQRSVVARLCNRAPYSHVERYRRPTGTAAFAGNVEKLLDALSYGLRWPGVLIIVPSGARPVP
jgi:hypothetical protein